MLGVGNAMRGDDGIGPLLARRLEPLLPAAAQVRVLGADPLRLVESCDGVDALLCIDASEPRGRPGRVLRMDLKGGELPRAALSTSSHGLGLAEAIALARALGAAPRRIVLYAVEAAGFEAGAAPGPKLARAARGLLPRLRAEILRLQGHRPPRRAPSRHSGAAALRVCSNPAPCTPPCRTARHRPPNRPKPNLRR